ncbi:MAG: NAD(P)-dependent oxidoreductase [Rhodobacteraceae bacterium]|nr:NAD(P)-dependent oxidoreductase [Paracoccaceae bacterium]
MNIPATLVMGSSGRIGQLLRLSWPRSAELVWQARCPPLELAPEAVWDFDWRILDPMADPEGLARAARGAEVILCLAGVVPGSRRNQPLSDNAGLALAAVHAAARAGGGARVILTSSAAVYGSQPGLLDEDSPLQPASGYGRAKAEMEMKAAVLAAELGVQVTALRIGNIAGLDAALGGWRPGFRLDRFPCGRTPRRSYIGAAALARVLAALVAAPALPPVLNVAQPGTVAMGELLQAAGLPYDLQAAPEAAIPDVQLDVSRLMRLLPAEVPLEPGNAGEMASEWTPLAPHLHLPAPLS